MWRDADLLHSSLSLHNSILRVPVGLSSLGFVPDLTLNQMPQPQVLSRVTVLILRDIKVHKQQVVIVQPLHDGTNQDSKHYVHLQT